MKSMSSYIVTPFPRLARAGYYLSLSGVVLIMVWIGIFKFTPTEAASIKPLVENHFLLSWLYAVWNVQQVSNLFGVIEIITGLLLLSSLKFDVLRPLAALCLIATFMITISFLFTTPGMWNSVDGVPTTNFMILKDIPMLRLGLMYLRRSPYSLTQ
ncbi:MAG: YkgB family protein [Parabacteroides sp.]|nr:YkgB family protein [Parabacteroides sp.]